MASFAYGQVTRGGIGGGSTPTPTATGTDLASIYPNLDATKNQASQNVLSNLKGELSPETLNAIQDQSARFGILSGSPMSQVAGSTGRKLLGQSVESLQGQGLQDYLKTLSTYSGTLAPSQSDITSRYGIDTGAATSRASIGQQGQLAGQQLQEQQRQFDISHYLQNIQSQAAQGNSYLNSYMNLLG